MARTPEYAIWAGAKGRCHSTSHRAYPAYGGTGIEMCRAWRDDFMAFLRDMGPRPSPKHSLDRYPNPRGNYEPGNVRWATVHEQNRNKRTNRNITVNGVTRTAAEWAASLGMTKQAVYRRIRTGWPPEQAVTVASVPAGGRHYSPPLC